jgi:hypothetical protein
MACKKEEGRELLHSPALLLLAPIHLSAWNRNSRKFAFTEFSEVVRRESLEHHSRISLICVMRLVPMFASVGGVVRL